MSFTIGSWNIGRTIEDYQQLFKDGKIPDPEERSKVEEFASKHLKASADVICLQEAEGSYKDDGSIEERKIIQQLEKDGFEIHRSGNRSDTVIAINKEKFKNIKNYSCEIGAVDYAIALATEEKTGKRFAFVSAHVGGMTIRPQGVIDPSDEDRVASGDQEVRELLRHLKTIEEDCDGIIIGGDFNVIHNRNSETFQRLNLLKGDGYTLQKSENVTNRVTAGRAAEATGQEDRELDYFAIKLPKKNPKSLWGRFKRVLAGKKPSILEAGNAPIKLEHNPFDPKFDPKLNPSDHRPIYMRVEISASKFFPNLFSNLKKSLSNLFKKNDHSREPIKKEEVIKNETIQPKQEILSADELNLS